ncbi:MAG: nucleotidyl transferase AbiEii/AbiGii toxin family protein [bacterium]|nr:nucleotidyl transferase AbiEii/AbiGii toxin family protein [bacterium]
MDNQILSVLKQRLQEVVALGVADAETQRNALKEELQYYVLDFIYHHQEYKRWVMYGGSALRICHGLDRMSVDLDFEVEHPITDAFLTDLQNEIGEHFSSAYNVGSESLTVKTNHGRGLTLRFIIGDELGFGHTSNQVHVKIDLNNFMAPKTVIERRPINHNQLSFVIVTYNMSALMASKIAAIFLCGRRGIGEAVYEEKGRDIYDLLWYMGKKTVPDLDYLNAKKVEEAKDIRTLFTKLTIQMNKVNNENLKQDLTPLFTNQGFITHWLENWRESFFHFMDAYKIRTVTKLEGVRVFEDFNSDVFSFVYAYSTAEGDSVRVAYLISDYWMDFKDGDIPTVIDNFVDEHIEFAANGVSSRPASQKKLKQYATMFYAKTEAYFKKTGRIMIGDTIATKLIRMTADKLNQKEQIVLNKSALLSCELDDLLR